MKTKTKAQVVSEIRKEWMSYPKKFTALQKCAERVQIPGGRWKTLIRCARCQEQFARTEIQCNHREPVGPLASTALADVLAYRARMFCAVELLEPLCIPCHRLTTQDQRNQ